jgi:transketolase
LHFCADLIGSLKFDDFKTISERFFQIGIAEANMIGTAGFLNHWRKIPFTGTFANFSTRKSLSDHNQLLILDKMQKICASYAGLTLGEDATYQILEDIGLMKMLLRMTVITCGH